MTIYDEAAEKLELAKTYAEDGAFHTAAMLYREVAAMYDDRAHQIANMKPDDGSEDGGDWMNGDIK